MSYGREKHRTPRNITLIMDWIHIIFGFLIVLMAIITFLNPERYMFLFPFIFLLASLLNLLNGVHRYRQSGRIKKKKMTAAGQLLIAAFLLVMTVISAVSIWG